MINFDVQFVQRNDVSKDLLKDAIPEFCLIDNIQSYILLSSGAALSNEVKIIWPAG